MLNFIYYPVSAILWFWHKAFGFVLGANSGFAWALSVIFLVFTLRVVLYKPFVNQVRTQRQMQEFQPQIKALQKKYAGDKQRLAVEMQKLQKENGFNPIAGCLPVLAQAPVFIGLFHVLRSFNRTGESIGQLGLTVEQNRELPNYVFSVEDVNSFLNAKLFGAPLSSAIRSTTDQLAAFGGASKTSIVAVAVPLMVIAAIATHFTARASVARQAMNPTAAAAAPQAALMNKLVLWVFPFFVLFGGPFLPIAILLYWLSNNGWTLAQQHYVFGVMAKEEAVKKSDAQERKAASAPKPGAKPTNLKKGRTATAAGDTAVSAAPDGPAGESVAETEQRLSLEKPAPDPGDGSPRPRGSRTGGAAGSATRRKGSANRGPGGTRGSGSSGTRAGSAGRKKR